MYKYFHRDSSESLRQRKHDNTSEAPKDIKKSSKIPHTVSRTNQPSSPEHQMQRLDSYEEPDEKL